MKGTASPLIDDHSTKRACITPVTGIKQEMPENIIDIAPDGGAMLILSGLSNAPNTPIGLRVCHKMLSMTSPVFNESLTAAAYNMADNYGAGLPNLIVSAQDDNGDAMYILCSMLHLRFDKLPVQVTPETLRTLANVARKYQCVVAVGRATLQWFQRLYLSKNPGNVWKIIEAAYLLDEPIFFARFTSRWVLEQSVYARAMPLAGSAETQKLAFLLADRYSSATTSLRNDLDKVVNACSIAFSKRTNKHYIDWAPGMKPDVDATTGQYPPECQVDPEAAMQYLGALSDAQIWPSSTWEQRKVPGRVGETIGGLIDKLENFREGEYDDADKCEFCDDIKIKFTEQLDITKQEQKDRLWGLCLDCYNAGGFHVGECRFEHAKPRAFQQNGLGIAGL